MRRGVVDGLYYIRRLLSLFRLVLGGKRGGGGGVGDAFSAIVYSAALYRQG